jgi:5-methyltetrahydropteroyltriglutamate--homocysteine methyltransferase
MLLFQDRTGAEHVKIVERHIALLDKAIAGPPRDRIRRHIRRGNREEPHVFAIGLEPLLKSARPGHRRRAVDRVRQFSPPVRICARKRREFPDSTILIFGIIDSGSNDVERPEVAAQRTEPTTAMAGDRDRQVAGVDSGAASVPAGNGSPNMWCG